MKYAFFYFDDVIWLFRDLTREKHRSIFDHFYLKTFKEAHEKYGFKVQMNVFYRTDYFYSADEFTLRDMTDAYREEFRANADWLQFGFHAKQEFPDYPLVNVTYDDMVRDFEAVKREVVRFAGEECFSPAVCSHWRPISKAGCRALADNGVTLINCTGGDVREYSGKAGELPYGHGARVLHNRCPEARIFTRPGLNRAISNSICSYNHLTTEELERTNHSTKTVYNAEIGVHFKQMMTDGVVVNRSKLEDMEAEYAKMLPYEFVGFGGHEQYFYPDYYGYQAQHGQKLLAACRIMAANGFSFVLAGEVLEMNRGW